MHHSPLPSLQLLNKYGFHSLERNFLDHFLRQSHRNGSEVDELEYWESVGIINRETPKSYSCLILSSSPARSSAYLFWVGHASFCLARPNWQSYLQDMYSLAQNIFCLSGLHLWTKSTLMAVFHTYSLEGMLFLSTKGVIPPCPLLNFES